MSFQNIIDEVESVRAEVPPAARLAAKGICTAIREAIDRALAETKKKLATTAQTEQLGQISRTSALKLIDDLAEHVRSLRSDLMILKKETPNTESNYDLRTKYEGCITSLNKVYLDLTKNEEVKVELIKEMQNCLHAAIKSPTFVRAITKTPSKNQRYIGGAPPHIREDYYQQPRPQQASPPKRKEENPAKFALSTPSPKRIKSSPDSQSFFPNTSTPPSALTIEPSSSSAASLLSPSSATGIATLHIGSPTGMWSPPASTDLLPSSRKSRSSRKSLAPAFGSS